MSRKKRFFEIDRQNKTFIFPQKFYKELFVNGSEVNEAFKAAMALGCYEGYVPVEKPIADVDKRNTAIQQFTAAGVEEWIKVNNPDWLQKWQLCGQVVMMNNEKFSFMVRKNYFLFENPAARAYCGMKPKANKAYELKPNAVVLRSAVEAKIAQLAKEKKGEA